MINKLIIELNDLFLFLNKNIESLNDQSKYEDVFEELCYKTRNIASTSHCIKHHIDWSKQPPPEWYNHLFDLYWQFYSNQNSHWIERGIYSNNAINLNSKVLELCCGDGFFSHHFYSTKASSVLAIDFDESAIKHAKKNYGHNKKIKYELGDIRKDIPDDTFDNVIWDAAIEHFNEKEIEEILLKINKILNKKGILSGQTIKENGVSLQLEHHEKEFSSKEEIENLLSKYFTNVLVFETIHVNRHNFYFYASDDVIPFQSGHKNFLWRNK